MHPSSYSIAQPTQPARPPNARYMYKMAPRDLFEATVMILLVYTSYFANVCSGHV